MRFAGGADIAAVEQQPVVGTGDVLFRKMLNQLFLNRFRGFGGVGDKSETVRNPEDMCIYRHGSLVEGKR